MYQNSKTQSYAAITVVACFYSYTESYVLVGHVGQLQVNKKLVINSGYSCQEMLPDAMAHQLQTHKHPIWINKSLSLKTALLNVCNELDFDPINELEIRELEGLFEGLKKEERIVIVGDVTLDNTDICTNAMKILLRALSENLWTQARVGRTAIAGGNKLLNPFGSPNPNSIRW
jgi:hypothetical protein